MKNIACHLCRTWTGIIVEDSDSVGQSSMPFGSDGRLKFVFEKITIIEHIYWQLFPP
jgi:hypothetical protein